jgi:hypothetical protein
VESWNQNVDHPRFIRAPDHIRAVSVEFVVIKMAVGVGELHGVGDYISLYEQYFCRIDRCAPSMYIREKRWSFQ